MARSARKCSFGSPPAEHFAAAAKHLRVARTAAVAAVRQVRDGSCQTAFTALTRGEEALATAGCHLFSGGHDAGLDVRVRRLKRVLAAAGREFGATCVRERR